MPGSYFMWLGFVKKNELELESRAARRKRDRHGEFELRLLGKLSDRRGHRDGALYRSILRTQIFQVYDSPGGRILKKLDACIGRLIMEMDLCDSIYSRDKVTARIKEELGGVIRHLKRASNSRFFQKANILRYVLNQLTVSATSIQNQVIDNTYSDRFVEYLRKRAGYFIKAYQGTIGKDLVLAEEQADELAALIKIQPEVKVKKSNPFG